MKARKFVLLFLSITILTQSALAESASYHLKRLEIQAKAFLAQLEEPPGPLEQPSATVDQQLSQSVDQSSWAENMAREDVNSILSTTPTLIDSVKSGDKEEYLKAKIELESLARRLRISTSPLELDAQQTASLELLMLELEESAAVLSQEREQLMARQDSARRADRRRFSVGLGLGYGGWGGWGPWGYNGWGAGPFYRGGFYRPNVYRRPYCR